MSDATDVAADVLIVDDEAPMRDLLARTLVGAGYRVRVATNAHDALRTIAQAAPAVAICDVHMPGPTGIWLADQIRQHAPHIAMVLATSDETIPPMETLRSGIVAYIIKPIRRHDVLAAVADGYRWWSEQSGHEVPALVAPPPDAASSDRAPVRPAAASPRSGRRGGPEAFAEPPVPVWGVAWSPTLPTVLMVVVVLALIVAGIYWWTQQGQRRALSRLAASTGVVLTQNARGQNIEQGSGFFVGPDLFVTSYHVVEGATTARIVVAGQEYRASSATAVDSRLDIIVLKTTPDAAQSLALAATVPSLGDPISVYGAPLGLKGTLSVGIVSATPNEASGEFQMTAPISPGSSGSPVVNAAGEVVGVASSSNTLGQALNFAVPAALVKRLLDRQTSPAPLALLSHDPNGR